MRKKELDPNGRYLIHDDGTIYIWSEALAKLKKMRPYTPGGGPIDPAPVGKQRVEIELQGKTFMVEQDLYDVLTEMGGAMLAMQTQIEEMTARKTDTEAKMERLTTDNADLTEQLEAVSAELRALKMVQPEASAENKDTEAATGKNKGKGK